MKAKVILYGWAASWVFLFAGIGTMEHGGMLAGGLLCAVWLVFCRLLIGNERACGEEARRLERWMARWLGGKP